jgi:hypothetical protein
MTALARLAPAIPPAAVPGHVACGAQPGVLAAIGDAAINLAIWQRAVPGDVAADAALLLQEAPADVRIAAPLAAVAGALAAAMDAAGWPHVPALLADVAALAALAAPRFGTPCVDVRLEVIAGDACRKFHADHVPLRLITSHAGPGSQWLRNEDAAALAAGAAINQIAVQQLATGDVALFKGRLLTDTPIIHRSPPIAGSGVRRLVLVINPAAEG